MGKKRQTDAIESLKQRVGKKFKGARKIKRISQCTLHKETGITTAFISQIELGKANPSLEMMVTLAKALDLPLNDLLL